MLVSEVQLYVPRFKLESSFELSDSLAEMGMRDAFAQGAADFSGIDGTRHFSISKVVHKAWAEVNEEGSEAAAATAIIAWDSALIDAWAARQIPVFRADHPFVFLIRDSHSGSVLFVGRVADPSK